MLAEARVQVRHNFIVNVLDGTFFGFGLGVASYQTVLPLFIATLTDSTVLIGIIAAVHMLGWQLPQVLTSGHVAALRRYKPFVIAMTIQERIPYLGLAIVALAAATIGSELALVLAFVFALWQSFGGGFTATGWQSMIAKLMPPQLRGTFYGVQSAGGYLMASLGAVVAGWLLQNLESPYNFAACFALAGAAMTISLGFIAQTREEPQDALETEHIRLSDFGRRLKAILQRDGDLRWFIVARVLAQFGLMAGSFFAIYAVRRFDVSAQTAGVMTGTMMLAQGIGNVFLGWFGDRWGHRNAVMIGAVVISASAICALAAQDTNALYVAFALAGVGYGALWTTMLALTVEFGSEAERPYYIGLSNTLTAPATLLAPIVGGWLADAFGFSATFGLAAACGIATIAILALFMRDMRSLPQVATTPAGD